MYQINQVTKSRQYIVVDENKALDTFSTWEMFFKRWNDYKGRSRRAEYWKVWKAHLFITFICTLIFFACMGLNELVYSNEFTLKEDSMNAFIMTAIIIYCFYLLYLIISMFPHFALLVRRLHDLNSSGWWAIMNFIPPLWPIILILYCVDGNPEPNEWGESPKYIVNRNKDYKKTIPGF